MKKLYRIFATKRKGINIFILLLLITGQSFAKTVNQDRAKQVATHFINGSSSLRSGSELSLVYTATDDLAPTLRTESNPLYYIYNVSNQGGFVIVAGDDKVMPVLGYADEGSFQTDDMPDNLKYWLDLYKEEIAWAIENKQEAGNETAHAWDALLTGNTTRSTTKDLLLTTANWNQSEPFNDLCPRFKLNRTVTGCVATAVGIIMKYHNWPETGTGNISYTTKTHSIQVTADFNIAYDWNNMPDNYTSDTWTAEQKNAVATLLFHCGAASQMNYGVNESGTDTRLAKHALINNFGYDNGMYYTRKNFYTTSEWDAMIRKELEENRPVLYGGLTKTKKEGHQFIIDGYDSQDFYHINWGWGGLANGYYLLSSLQPSEQGIGGSDDGAGFSTQQDILIGFEKAKEGSLPGYEFYFPLEGPYKTYGLQTNAKTIRKGESFDLGFSYIWDAGLRDFEGYIAFFVVNKNGVRKELLGGFQTQIPGDYPVLFNLSDQKYEIKGTVEEGDKIQLFFSVDAENWKVFHGDKQLARTELPIGSPINLSNDLIVANEDVSVYPTTAESVINIESQNNTEIQHINLYHLTGRLVKNQKVNATDTRTTLVVSDLKSGIYILSVQTSKGRRSYKIIKK